MSVSNISIKLLKPHPKNKEYYGDLELAKYEELKHSIFVHGIRDPLKVLPDFTIIAGHQRYKIALELDIEKVPVKIEDICEGEAEYLLIADNEERRQIDDDPIRKAKRAKFLKEYWEINRGGDRKLSDNSDKISKGQIVPLMNCQTICHKEQIILDTKKNLVDVAQAIGENEKTTKRLLKLNDLIPELQAFVSSGKLGTTVAYELAFLSPETQKALHDHYGQQIAEIKHMEAKELRRKIEAEIDIQNSSQISLLQEKIKGYEEKNKELQILQNDQENELKRAIANLRDKLEESIPEEKMIEMQRELKFKEKELAQEKQNTLEIERKYGFQIQEFKKQIKILQENPSEKIVIKEVEKILPDSKIIKELEEARMELAQLKYNHAAFF